MAKKTKKTFGRFKGGKRPKAQTTWKEWEYNPFHLKNRDEKELRNEYSRLRSILRKRYERIHASDLGTEEDFAEAMASIPKLADIKSKKDLIHILSQAAKDLMSYRTDLKQLKKKRDNFIETMHQHGYKFINEGNYVKFSKFMELARHKGLLATYDSERLVEFYDTGVDQKENFNESLLESMFERWLEQNGKKESKYSTPKEDAKGSQYARDYANKK